MTVGHTLGKCHSTDYQGSTLSMLVAVMLFLSLQSPSEGKTLLRKPEFRLAAAPVQGGAVAGQEQVPVSLLPKS